MTAVCASHGRFWLAAVAVFSVLGVQNVAGAPSQSEELEKTIARLVRNHEGKTSIAVRHLKRGVEFTYRADEPMPTASLIKLPVMVEAYRQASEGEIDLDGLVKLREEDKVPGSGILTPHFSAGVKLPLRDAVRLMISHSDNTATNLVVDRVRLQRVNATMQALGLAHTRIHSKVFRRDTSILPERSRQFGLGSTTAGEMVRLLEKLHRRELVSAEASEAMLEHLLACEDRAKIARHLPSDVRIAQKGGSVSAVRTSAGILYFNGGPVAICVLTSENQDRRWSEDNAAELLCAEVGRTVFDHFSEGKDPRTDDTNRTLEIGDSGRLVEDLQRTLNARLSPSPELAVDGAFGPVTEAAVIRFQEENDLEANGVVGPETWTALGTLVTQDEPVPAPETINNQKLPTQPPDSLDGPPFVTCKAWAVADGRTGEVLWGHHEDQPLDIASTTKIMTGYLVAREAERDPKVLNQQVMFSERADQTEGSTAGVRAGERLPIGELLYGLLLPSGNDASVALAEHFGASFDPAESGNGSNDALARFLAEMNRQARAIGMQHTQYQNPHGLTAEMHMSTCRDLLRLSWTAMQNPIFRTVIKTRQHGCRVTGPGGYQRNLMWKNTNRLLPIEGYDGIKTGTTRAAGACLVSSGRRGDDHLLVAVLGSSSSDARYVDTRNLFRWAWKQRAARDDASE